MSKFVLLASYPKSGNTWARALLTAWRGGKSLDLDALDGLPKLIDRHLFEEEAGIDSDLLEPSALLEWRSRYHEYLAQRLSADTLVKVHDRCVRTRSGRLLFPPAATARVIYLVRNPLDVAVSFAHHDQQSEQRIVERMRCEESWLHAPVGGIRETLPQPLGSWSEHIRSWLDESGHSCLLVRYEDLLEDTLGQLRRMIEFLGKRWNDERGRRAVRETSFETLQEAESRLGFRERPSSCPQFFRKGQAGTWRDSLASPLVRQLCADHLEMMERFHYTVAPP